MADDDTDSDDLRMNKAARAAYRKDQDGVFALVKASSEYAARESAARLARVPKTPFSHMSLLFTYWVIFSVIGLAVAAVPWVFSSAIPDPKGAWFLFALGLLFSGMPGMALLFTWWRIHRFDAGEVTSRAVIIEGQHSVSEFTESIGKSSSTTSGPTVQRVSFVDAAGKRTAHFVRDKRLARRLMVGDAGVLFLRRNWVVDFDCVLTGDEIRAGQMPGAVVCRTCETVYRLDESPSHCKNCGDILPRVDRSAARSLRRPYSPWLGWLDRWVDGYENRKPAYEVPQPSLKHRMEGSVTCGWCGRRYDARPDTPGCKTCGGPLPMPPGGDAGRAPPAPPRRLPAVFKRRLYVTKNLQTLVCGSMLILSLTCCLPILFFSIPAFFLGGLGLCHSLMKARQRSAALSRGTPVLGKIEQVVHIGTGPQPQPNEISTYRVAFRFDVDGEPLQGIVETLDDSVAQRFTGEPVWVVYVPNKPYMYAIWPPLA